MNDFNPVFFYLDSLSKNGKLTIERIDGGSSYMITVNNYSYYIMGPLTEEKLMTANISILASIMLENSKKL